MVGAGVVVRCPVSGRVARFGRSLGRSGSRHSGHRDRPRKPGTSVLFAVTDEGDLERLGERFRGFNGHLVSTNLTGVERSLLLETFD